MVFAKLWNIVTFVTKFLFCCGNTIFFIKKIGYLVSGEAVSHGTLSIPALHRDMTETEEDESFSRTSMMQEERKVIPLPGFTSYQNDINLELLRAIFVAMWRGRALKWNEYKGKQNGKRVLVSFEFLDPAILKVSLTFGFPFIKFLVLITTLPKGLLMLNCRFVI